MLTPRSAATSSVANILVKAWYQQSRWLYCLLPLSYLYHGLSSLRRGLYLSGLLQRWKPPVPVIMVGNITVGGTGKTPLVIALVNVLQEAGYKPGIVSRGYGSKAPFYPFLVSADKSPEHCGDEPLLMAIRTQVPVVIDANRMAAAKQLVAAYDCDVIVSDDGLQHYALQRDIELVVVDGQRGFANQQLLPAGPLRESIARLKTVDFVISNGELVAMNRVVPGRVDSRTVYHTMQLQPSRLQKLNGDDAITVQDWSQSKQVHAVAGIGNPDRFYTTLRQLGFEPIEHSYVDHHHYKAEDLQFGDDLPVIMTEKDAVKVRNLIAPDNSWYLPVDAIVDQSCFEKILQQLHTLTR
ncbi:MAG: tetraacyldisaccharide 4'-kinase [Pseudomonadales bacterium]